MKVHIEKRGEVTVVGLTGELDATTVPEVQARLNGEVSDGVKLLLDMRKVRYMSSAGLRLLLSLYRKVQARGGDLVLVGLSDPIRDTMEVTGFLTFFQAYEGLEDGMRVLEAPR